jgi:hypothetical protein
MKKLTLLLCLIPFIGFSQKVSVESISESRSTQNSIFGNRCEVMLKISGDEVRKYKMARISKVSKAVDDQGLDLIGEESNNSRYGEISGTAASVSAVLLTTSRSASVIRELDGEVVLFSPTEANGGLTKVKTFGKNTNKNLVPNVQGLSVTYVTKESVEKFNAEQKSKKQAELKKQPKEVQEFAKELMNLMDAFSYMGGTENEVNFFISGDEHKLINVFFENTAGDVIENNGWSSSGGLKTYYFSEAIKPAYTLVLTLESAGATKKIPFSLKDIELP